MYLWVVPILYKSATALSESCTCVQIFRKDVQSQQNLIDIFKQLAGQGIFTGRFQMMGMTKKNTIATSAWSLSSHFVQQC